MCHLNAVKFLAPKLELATTSREINPEKLKKQKLILIKIIYIYTSISIYIYIYIYIYF